MEHGAPPASAHLMLISPERVFYAGLLGEPRQRTSAGLNVYVALRGELSVAPGGMVTRGEMVVVPPYTVHSVDSDDPSTVCLVIEPEPVLPSALRALEQRLRGPAAEAMTARIRGAYDALRIAGRREGFTTCEFDTIFFGEPLEARTLDRRIVDAIARLCEFSSVNVNAAECAAAARLSQSRFLHLFKEQTGVSFRAFRAWKRARHLLHYVNEDINLAHLAQDIGYPDSTRSAASMD